MDAPRALAFAAIALVVIAVPGPSVLFIVGRAVAVGRRAALITVLGNTLGEMLQVLVVALGMGELLQRSALIFTVVKLLGAAYLCYLGLMTWRQRRGPVAEGAAGASRRAGRHALKAGLVVGATNPKSMVFLAAVLPQFAQPSLGHLPIQLLGLGLVWAAIAIVSDSAWAFLAGSARDWLLRRPGHLEHAQGASAVVMVGLGAGLALSSRAG